MPTDSVQILRPKPNPSGIPTEEQGRFFPNTPSLQAISPTSAKLRAIICDFAAKVFAQDDGHFCDLGATRSPAGVLDFFRLLSSIGRKAIFPSFSTAFRIDPQISLGTVRRQRVGGAYYSLLLYTPAVFRGEPSRRHIYHFLRSP